MAGLYVHIPYCLKKCGYCDFYSEAAGLETLPAFLSALEKEWDLYTAASHAVGGIVETLYMGGGTPSILEPEAVHHFLSKVLPFLTKSPQHEISIEANPATLSSLKLKGYRQGGINRISIGAQSFDDATLKLLGRLHSAEEGKEAVRLAREAGFDNIGIDLIYGIPEQSLEDWKVTLRKAASLSPDHISTYALTWSFATPLGKKIESGLLPKPDEDLIADMSLLSTDLLGKAGYEQYEISNFAKPGRRSKHNEAYWTGKPYLGLGPSAHSLIGNKRFWNVSSIGRYIEMLGQNRLPIEDEEMLSPEDIKLERLAVGLRRKEGVSVAELEIDAKKSTLLVHNNYAKLIDGMLSLTPKGMLLADEIAMELV